MKKLIDRVREASGARPESEVSEERGFGSHTPDFVLRTFNSFRPQKQKKNV